MEKFKLFMCCLGNGITVCNSAVKSHGDYKYIAHISEGGNIRWYVHESHVPEDARRSIESAAMDKMKDFRDHFEALPHHVQYGIILNSVKLTKLVEFTADKRELSETLPEMREYYYTIA